MVAIDPSAMQMPFGPVAAQMGKGTKAVEGSEEDKEEPERDPAALAQTNAFAALAAADPSTQMAMQQYFMQATSMAKSMGYFSLEAMLLHRQAMMKAGGETKKRSNPETVFCGGLRKTTSDEQVIDHFKKFGEVVRCDVIRSLDGSSRGFAFVRFATQEDVQRVLDAKFEHWIDEKWVDVRMKDSRAADAGKSASKAVEMAAATAGVEPSQYLNYLTNLAMVQYGYGTKAEGPGGGGGGGGGGGETEPGAPRGGGAEPPLGGGGGGGKGSGGGGPVASSSRRSPPRRRSRSRSARRRRSSRTRSRSPRQ